MAKFAQVGYGHDGRAIGNTDGGYTYIVNDNVRTGDVIVPIPAFNKRANREISTMAKVVSTTKDIDRKTTRTRGVSGNLLENQKFTSGKSTSNETIRDELEDKGLIESDDNGKAINVGLKDISTEKGILVRNYGNDALYKQQLESGLGKVKQENIARKNGETFDSYSKQFMGD